MVHRFWSKRVGRPAAVLAAATVVLLAACGDAPTAVAALKLTEGAPFVQGRVERTPVATDDWGYLVLAPSEPGEDPNGAYFHVGPQTRLLWEDGEAATTDALQIGRQVSVWADPRYPVLASLPPKIAVTAIVLHDRGSQ